MDYQINLDTKITINIKINHCNYFASVNNSIILVKICILLPLILSAFLYKLNQLPYLFSNFGVWLPPINRMITTKIIIISCPPNIPNKIEFKA